jgi:hypothetical protein
MGSWLTNRLYVNQSHAASFLLLPVRTGRCLEMNPGIMHDFLHGLINVRSCTLWYSKINSQHVCANGQYPYRCLPVKNYVGVTDYATCLLTFCNRNSLCLSMLYCFAQRNLKQIYTRLISCSLIKSTLLSFFLLYNSDQLEYQLLQHRDILQ